MTEIYSDFYGNMLWIRGMFKKDLAGIPRPLHKMADYYLSERVAILPKEASPSDAKYGTPMPHLVFWFADAMNLQNSDITNKLALSLLYANVFYCIRDDIIDGKTPINGRMADDHEYIALANYFFSKYVKIFRSLFSQESSFWYHLAISIDDWGQSDYWSYLIDAREPLADLNVLSKEFLHNSSKYIVGITLPSIVAVALLTGNGHRVNAIRQFLVSYFMGYRIADDMRDWATDLAVKNYNRSTVIHLGAKFLRNPRLIDASGMASVFLDKQFVNLIYPAILEHYKSARRIVSDFGNAYLNEFMDTQISYFESERDRVLGVNEQLQAALRKTFHEITGRASP